jgi:mono/diheme cytochrome c family protein
MKRRIIKFIKAYFACWLRNTQHSGLRTQHLLLSTCYLALLLAGCADAPGSGDVANGKRIFNGEVVAQTQRGALPSCKQCHGIAVGASASRGPNLVDIGKTAGTRVAGMSAEAYLRASIIDPDAYLVRSYQEGIMPKGYREALNDAQVEDLLAYMLTLR